MLLFYTYYQDMLGTASKPKGKGEHTGLLVSIRLRQWYRRRDKLILEFSLNGLCQLEFSRLGAPV